MWITMGEAEKIVPVARSTFRKHAKAGKFSTSTNARGLQIVQVAELERYFDGNLKPLPNQNGKHGNGTETHETSKIDHNGHTETPPQTQEIIDLLKSELADAKERERQLLSMLESEQKKTERLMLAPPPSNRETPPAQNGKQNWWQRLTSR